MHFNTLLRNSAIIITALIVTFTSCKRKNDTQSNTLGNTDDNGGYASDAAKMESTGNDVISLADAAAASGTSYLRTTSSCSSVFNDTVNHKLTISFGSTNCLCADGKKRRGDIVVAYTGHYKDSGSTHTITYDHYFVEDMQLTGSKMVVNKGKNTSGNVWYSVTVNDSLIVAPDSIISWKGNRTRTWLAGYSTPSRADDAYQIEGVTTLTRANGHVFTHTIISPLKVEISCHYIESGIVKISSTTFTSGDRTLDYGYGGGGCDVNAQLTIGTHTYVITLR